MKKTIVKIILFTMRVIMGVMDTVLPNVKNSVKDQGLCPVTKKPEIKVDWPRFLAAAITFILLILNFLGLIDLKTIQEITQTLGK
jgi:hypothetical protein